jgi:hypothetical protein
VRRAAVAGLALVVALGLAACGTAIVPREPLVLTVPGMVGTDMQLEIVDETGELVDAQALSREELGAFVVRLEGPIVAWAGSTSNEARIMWISFSCETTGRLTISNPNKVTITPGPTALCPAIGNQRAVNLVFRVPVNPSALQVEVQGFSGEKG